MYLKHFGLTAFPFDKQIPAEDLFVSAALHELAVRLGYLRPSAPSITLSDRVGMLVRTLRKSRRAALATNH